MICHQKIVRDKKATEPNYSYDLFTPAEIPITDIALSEIKEIGYSEAAAIILDYEWLGTMPAQLYKAVGLFFDGTLSAVECFSTTRPAGFYTVEKKPAVCLARGACCHWCPPWASSKLISASLKLLDSEKYWYAVAYSDTDAGEIGTVYQASNWTCLGPVSRGNKYWLDPSGKRYDHERPRSVARSRDPDFKIKKRLNPEIVKVIISEMISDGWTHVVGGKRFRYAVPLYRSKKQRRTRQAILDKIACEYPKRVRDA